jgi:hypothetical protein
MRAAHRKRDHAAHMVLGPVTRDRRQRRRRTMRRVTPIVEAATRIDSLDDLNFIKEPLITSGPFVCIGCLNCRRLIETVSRTIPSPKVTSTTVTSADADQRPTGPVSKGQRPRGQRPEGQRKASINPASSQPVCVQLTGTARQKPLKLFGPSVAPVVRFVLVVSLLRLLWVSPSGIS